MNNNKNFTIDVPRLQGKAAVTGRRVGIVAHRGAHRNGPSSPNSLTAFREAIQMGCYAFECDVLFSSDGHVVVAHGPTTGHDGGRPDITIHSSSWEELSAVSFMNGDHLPLLGEVLDEVKKQEQTRLVIEIKVTEDGRDLELARDVYQQVTSRKAGPWVEYISFDYRQLLEILKMDPAARCSPLESCRESIQAYLKDGMWGVDFEYNQYTPELLRACREAGLQTNAWTVNDGETMKKLIDWGIDLITTDEPELLSGLNAANA